MPTPPLPQEILDQLVDCVRLELDSLKSLALTSPRFLHRSQSYLYRTLRINREVTRAKRNILNRNSSLLKLVRELYLTFEFSTPPAHALGLAEHQIALSRVIDELQGLELLHLHADSHVTWDEVSPICQNLIPELLAHPLRQLSLVGLTRVPPHLVCPALINTVETCKLRDVTLELSEPCEMRPLRMKTLQCAGLGIAFMAQLLSTARFTVNNLVDLHIGITSNVRTIRERTAALELISQTSHRLKSLAVEYPYHFLSEFYRSELAGEDLSLPTMPALRYLRIHLKSCLRVPHENHAIHTSMPRLLHAMLSGNPQPVLEALDLLISWTAHSVPQFDSLAYPPVHLLTKHNHHWDAVDEVLSNPAIFPELRGVRITPSIQFSPDVFRWHAPDSKELKDFQRIVPRQFHFEVMAVLETVHTRLPVFEAGWVPGKVEETFDMLKTSVLDQAGINGGGI